MTSRDRYGMLALGALVTSIGACGAGFLLVAVVMGQGEIDDPGPDNFVVAVFPLCALIVVSGAVAIEFVLAKFRPARLGSPGAWMGLGAMYGPASFFLAPALALGGRMSWLALGAVIPLALAFVYRSRPHGGG